MYTLWEKLINGSDISYRFVSSCKDDVDGKAIAQNLMIKSFRIELKDQDGTTIVFDV